MSVTRVTVVDYGVGNLLSVQRGLERCGAEVCVSSNRDEILASNKVILPGVGAFADGMDSLDRLGLIEILQALGEKATPLLGICLGMQLLLDASDEFGFTKGLGLIPGKVVSIPCLTTEGSAQKIPHIGWNELIPTTPNGWRETILEKNCVGDSAYFVHSFMAVPDYHSSRIADCMYGGHRIAAVISRGNIIGCQFHPEKSGSVGLRVLQSFIEK